VNPDPNLVVEALRNMSGGLIPWNDGAKRIGRRAPKDYEAYATSILPHAEALAEIWPRMREAEGQVLRWELGHMAEYEAEQMRREYKSLLRQKEGESMERLSELLAQLEDYDKREPAIQELIAAAREYLDESESPTGKNAARLHRRLRAALKTLEEA